MTVRDIAANANFLIGGLASLAASIVHINEGVAVLTGRYVTAPETKEINLKAAGGSLILNLPIDFLKVRHLSILSNGINLRVDSRYYNVDDDSITLPMNGIYTLKYSAYPFILSESDVDDVPGIKAEFHPALIRYIAAQMSDEPNRIYHTLKFEELAVEANRQILRGGV